MTYSPWEHAGRLPHLIIDALADLPPGRRGEIRGNIIRLSRHLTQVGRRMTLAHELGHYERDGLRPADDVLRGREERAVDVTAARRLITIEALADALRWTEGKPNREAAWECWATLRMLHVRLTSLTVAERALLDKLVAADDNTAA